jgi:phospholipase C
MQGFVKSYFNQQHNVRHSHNILNYFTPDKLPVLTNLATEFAVYNRWFSSIPGPTLCNRAFAHYGSSFGQVSMDVFYWNKQYKSIYERLLVATPKVSSRLYYYDVASSSLEVVNLLQNQPELFGTFQDFKDSCDRNQLPQYCFIEPNYTDHDDPSGGGEIIASDQHPDHDVRAGEQFIADVYSRIRNNPKLWPNTAILVVYDEHGGIYDHVPPPACTPDSPYVAQPAATGTPDPFHFDRLGVRVPAILISPWVKRGTVINDVFEHASIPATATEFFIGNYAGARSPREIAANTFLNALSLPAMRPDSDCITFTTN